MPDPLGVLWAIRDGGGAIADFETGYSNPAMARMIGVPPEVSMGRRLLEETPDFRDDETFWREEIEGSGIGLAVCRNIVEAHGGGLWAEPADGAGTVMRFTLPV